MKHSSNLPKALQSFFLSNGGRKMTIFGGSMLPILKNGQIVEIIPQDFPLKKGRCYVFLKGSSLILHRLVAIRRGHGIFIGDNKRYPEIVSANRIIGELKCQPDNLYVKLICFTNFFLKLINIVPYISRVRICFLRLFSKLYCIFIIRIK